MNTTLFCQGLIKNYGRTRWWYKRCTTRSCYKQCFKQEGLGDKYGCKLHTDLVQTPIPTATALIEDDFSDRNITLIGSQAEQLFGYKVEVLKSKRFYASEEMTATVGRSYVFELRGNKYDEWIVVGMTQPSAETALA